jgi:hypothetical protein
MGDEPRSEEERLEELRQTGEVVGKLSSDAEAFARTVEAFRALRSWSGTSSRTPRSGS